MLEEQSSMGSTYDGTLSPSTLRAQDRSTWYHDRQPDLLFAKTPSPVCSDEDGDEFVLRSRQRQQRVAFVDVKANKKRRILPWIKAGHVASPTPGAAECLPDEEQSGGSQSEVAVGREWEGPLSPVVLIEDSQAEDGQSCGSTVSSDVTADSERCSSFVVDDSSESLAEEEDSSENLLALGALREVRETLLERIGRLERRLAAVNVEVDEREHRVEQSLKHAART